MLGLSLQFYGGERRQQGDWQPAKPTFKTHNCIERERERKREWEREGLG